MSGERPPLPAAGRSSPLHTLRHLVVGLRPRQWLKNAFVFPALLFSRTLMIPANAAAGLMLATLLAVPYQPQLSAETFQQVWSETAAGRPPSAATFGTARSVAFIQADPELNHPDNRIAYTEHALVYPLMGRTRQNRIYYVPATTYGDWLARLQAAQTTFLIIADDRAVEFNWVKQHPEDFVLWVRNWPFTIYVLRSDLPRNQLLINVRGGGAP